MRFGVRSKAVEKLEDVKTNLITVRRIIFTPNVDLKDELKNTSIQITCLDENGEVLKRQVYLKILLISFIYFSVRSLTYFCAF
jgi:hypothetical protein